jgi:Ca2+-binding EF-hand superfamily protein
MTRTRLQAHLDFFDSDADGIISFGENKAGWRRLGFSAVQATIKALTSSLIFGRGFSIDIARIGARRQPGTSGVYDSSGELDAQKLQPYLAAFKGGALSHAAFKELIRTHAHLGVVANGQFKSLLQLCEKVNGSKTITAEQFTELYDGTLLDNAARALQAK